MGLRINQNIAAMNAYRNLSVTDGQMAKSLEKLSSGFRINRAADDAAGLSISEGLRAQVGGLKVAVRNAQDGISVVQTAEGAMNEVHSILGRMRDLAVQASSSGSQDTNARTAAQTELSQLNAELDRIGSTTKFGSVNLLDGSSAKTTGAITGGTTGALAGAGFTLTGTFGGVAVNEAVAVANGTYNSAGAFQTALQNAIDNALTTDGATAGSLKATVSDVGGGVWKVELSSASVGNGNTFTVAATAGNIGVANGASSAQANSLSQTFQIGANNGETLAVSFNGISASILGTSSLDLVNSASSAITALDTAIQTVSTNRANLGAVQNRLEHTISNLSVAAENLSASESRIRDTDMAQEMVSFTRSQILVDRGGALGDLHDDAAAVRHAVDALDGPVVVVAHSYGGAPVSEGLVGAGNVAHLVYVTAFLLDEGESLLGAAGGVDPPWWRTSADGRTLEPDDPEHVFFADCPPDAVAAAVASLRPQSRAAFTQTLRGAAWNDIPSTYVVCDQDNAIPVVAQEAMAQRAGTVHRLSSGHSPFLSQPDELAKIVRQTVETSAAS